MNVPKSVKVLLADDHKIFREGIVSLLQEEEAIDIVAEAANGEEALDVMRNNPIDVILLDIKMPVMNGIELAEIVRKQYPSTKILVFTSYDESRYIHKMFKIGVNGYILKTASSDELITAIITVGNGNTYYSNVVSEKIRQYFFGSQEEEIQLTNREQEIIKLVAQGYTNAQIGEQLFISPRTVDTHRRNLLQKLDLHNAVELSHYAYKHGIMD